MRRTIGDAILSATGLLILVFALVATDHRVRERASMLIGGGPPLAGVPDLGRRMADLVQTAIHVVRVWSGEHVYLTILAVTAAVLVTAVRRL